MNNLTLMKKLFNIFIFFCILFGGVQMTSANIEFGTMTGQVSNPNDRGVNKATNIPKNTLLQNMKDQKNHVNVSATTKNGAE